MLFSNITMEKAYLDFILVPLGMLLMVSYHLWLLYRIFKYPTKTVIGVNAINRCFCVQAMMDDSSKNGVLAVQTFRNNIMASTLMASTTIMLSSLIAILMTSGSNDRSAWFIFDDRSDLQKQAPDMQFHIEDELRLSVGILWLPL